jgi:hypothetical protein
VTVRTLTVLSTAFLFGVIACALALAARRGWPESLIVGGATTGGVITLLGDLIDKDRRA